MNRKLCCAMSLAGIVAGCDGTQLPAPVIIPVDIPQNAPLLTRIILTDPDVASARNRAAADTFAVDEARAARAFQVTANGNIGGRFNSDETTDPVVTANLQAVRVIDDGGRIDSAIILADLQAEQSIIDFALTGDAYVQRLLTRIISRNAAQQTMRLIDANLARYEARRPLLDAAVANGVMTNADVLEIDALRNDIQTTRLDAEITLIDDDLALENDLAGFDVAQVTALMLQRFEARQTLPLTAAPAPARAQAMLRQQALQAGLLQEIASTRPETNFRTSLSVPIDETGGVSAFVGIDMSFVLADGGASAARQAAIAQREQAANLDRTALDRQIATAQDALRAKRQATARQRDLINRRLRISRDRLTEMEQLLRAGRSDIADIGREILSGAQAQIDLVEREADLQRQTVQTFALQGAACHLVAACDALIPERLAVAR